MPLFCLHLQKPFWINDSRTLSPKAMHYVCCFSWYWCIISWMAVVWLELVSLVSGILPLLCRFLAATCHWQTASVQRIQTRHFWWLASVKLWMQSRCSLAYKAFLTNQDRLYTSAPEMAWKMQMSTNCDSINAQRSTLLTTNLHSFLSPFPYFLGMLCLYLRNMRTQPYRQLISIQIRPNIDSAICSKTGGLNKRL